MSTRKKPCMACKKVCSLHAKGALKSSIADFGGTIFSSVNPRSNSKFHTVILTKRHTEDLRTLTDQEWNDILPVLKESIKKIENYYKLKGKPGPLGYRLTIPNGELAGANLPPHFYMRVVPKYKKDWGTVAASKFEPPQLSAFKEAQQKLFAALSPDKNKIIAQKDNFIARLHDEKEAPTHTRESLVGAIVISPKTGFPRDINKMDAKAWAEIGQMLQELMAKIEANTNCHDFNVDIWLGEEAAKALREEAGISSYRYYPDSDFALCLVPKHQKTIWWDGSRMRDNKTVGSMENERLAFKLNDLEAYYKEWGKKLPQQKEATNFSTKTNLQNQETKAKASIWKQPTTYLLIASGVGICLLGMGIYWLFSKKNKAK